LQLVRVNGAIVDWISCAEMGNSGEDDVIRKPPAKAGATVDVTGAELTVADESANMRKNNSNRARQLYKNNI